jgi:hypothetical protein
VPASLTPAARLRPEYTLTYPALPV